MDLITIALARKAASGVKQELDGKADAIRETASGLVAAVTDAADGAELFALNIAVTAKQSGSGDPSVENIRPIEGWTEVTASHEADGDTETKTVSWADTAGTVFGGVYEAVNGKMTADYAFLTLTGDEDWTWRQNDGYFLLKVGETDSIVPDVAVCSHLVENPNISGTNTQIGFRVYNRSASNDARLLIRFDSTKQQTLDEFIAYLRGQYQADTPVQVAYKLSSGTEYDVGKINFTTALGENEFSATTGEVSIEYAADVALYIDKQIAATSTPSLGFGNPFAGQSPSTDEEQEDPPVDDEEEAEDEPTAEDEPPVEDEPSEETPAEEEQADEQDEEAPEADEGEGEQE